MPLVICTVMFGIAFAFFKIQNALTRGGIRSDEADELAGLDLPELGVPAYPEFLPEEVVNVTGSGKDPEREREYVTAGPGPTLVGARPVGRGGDGWPSRPPPPR